MRKSATFVLLALLVCAAQAARAQRGPRARTPARRTAPAQPPQRQPAATPTKPAATADDCGCEAEVVPDVLAVVNGMKITTAEIDEPIKDRIQQLQQSAADARRDELDAQINSLLISAEAKRRGVTTEQLLRREVFGKVAQPTEAELRAVYDQNRDRLGDDYSAVRDQIAAYLREQRESEASKSFADRLRAAAQVRRLVAEATPPAKPADRARVFAVVNGAQITSAMIEDSIRPRVYDAQWQVYQMRKQQLDTKIDSLLLALEAQRRQVTIQSLRDSEINEKIAPVTEADARLYYDQNKEHIPGDFDKLKDQIVGFLQQKQSDEREAAFTSELRRAATVQTFLREPTAPVYQISTDDQPSRGAANAPVTLIEFTDYQCPSCAAFQPILERAMAEYAGRVRLVVRDFPLPMHANARRAAEAAEAARAQGKYWEYTSLLFANQQALDPEHLKEYATRVGLDRARFDAALESGQLAQKVQLDLNEGNRLDVHATPTIFVNGRPLEEHTYEGLKAMIDAALKEKGRG